MNKPRLFFILSILGIFILLIILNFSGYTLIGSSQNITKLLEEKNTKVVVLGNLSKIDSSESYISIRLKDFPEKFILFTNEKLNLTINQPLIIYGTLEIYQNQTQILVDKITVKNKK
jgi:uncharacterized SAM-binding protein YcdF (DUF218 family)